MSHVKHVHSQSQYEALLTSTLGDGPNQTDMVLIKAERTRDGSICAEFGTREELEAIRESLKNKAQQ